MVLIELLGALCVMFILCFIGVKIGDWRTKRRLMRELVTKAPLEDLTREEFDDAASEFALLDILRKPEESNRETDPSDGNPT